MGYKHRTKSGKVRHYQSRGHYERSLRGLFGDNYQKKNHSRKINKTKSKNRVKHRGIGKISSIKKERCNYCRKENLPLTDSRCKECEKLLAEFKQPTKHKLRAEIIDLGGSYQPNFDDEDLFKIQTLMDEINELDNEHFASSEVLGKMEEINKIMGGHGVEGIMEQVGDHTLDILYVNMGDTYDTTVIFDGLDGMVYTGNWGSWVEEEDNEGVQE